MVKSPKLLESYRLCNTAIALRITRDISDILTTGQKQFHANNCLIIKIYITIRPTIN